MGGNIKFNKIQEGGNVFKDTLSDKILKENIKPTLKEFFRELKRIFPGIVVHLEKVTTLGSVGKKSVSGDIDLAVDEKSLKNIEDWNLDKEQVQAYFEKFKSRARSASKEQILKKAVLMAIADKIKDSSDEISVNTKQIGSGTLFTQFPQYTPDGKKNGKYVQCDLMFGNPDWLKFSYYSDSYSEDGNVKGLHRTQLILHLFSAKGYIFAHGTGIKSKDTGEMVATTPDQAISLLSKLYNANFTQEILSNYYKLQEFLQENLDSSELSRVYDIYLKTLDSTRCDIPADLQNYWLDNSERLGLSGKYLPPSSKLYPFREYDE